MNDLHITLLVALESTLKWFSGHPFFSSSVKKLKERVQFFECASSLADDA